MSADMTRICLPIALISILAFGACSTLPGMKDGAARKTDKQKANGIAAEAAWLAECVKLGETVGTITGREGWLFAASELKAIGREGSTTSAVDAIADYAAALNGKGIELILVPVPPKAFVYPDKISKNVKVPIRSKRMPRLDSQMQAAMEALEAKNVSVVDLLPVLIASREMKTSTAFPRTSSTWAPAGVEAAAKEIAEAVKKSKAGSQAGSSSGIVAQPGVITFKGGLANGIENIQSESLPCVTVGRITGDKQKSLGFETSGGSLLMIGATDMLAWRENNNPAGSRAAFASLVEQLAAELQLIPDVISGGADAKNSARLRILRDCTNDQGALDSTKTVVWVVPALDLYSPSWARVPLQLLFSESGPDIQLR